jgi:IS5 family transposase
VDYPSRIIICTAFAQGRMHDWKLLLESGVCFPKGLWTLADSGYQGLQHITGNALIPFKGSKHNPLTQSQKTYNRMLSSYRVVVENVIRFLKRFHILTDRYRNRRKRFGLRFNLIAAIYNQELKL